MHGNHLEGFLKDKLPSLRPRVPDLAGLEWGPRICILVLCQVALMLPVQDHSSRTTAMRPTDDEDAKGDQR